MEHRIDQVKKSPGEFAVALLLFLFISGLIAAVAHSLIHDTQVLATSRDVQVMVTGKRIGSGKGRPRTVYVRDGVVPIGIRTTARWYFQAKIGQLTTVKYSPVYHEYRQPYHRTSPEKYFLGFLAVMGTFSLILIISAAKSIWFIKK